MLIGSFLIFGDYLKKTNTAIYYLTPLASIAALLLIFLFLKSPSDSQISTPDHSQVAIAKEDVKDDTKTKVEVEVEVEDEDGVKASDHSELKNNIPVNKTESVSAKVAEKQKAPKQVKIQKIEPIKASELASTITRETKINYAFNYVSSGSVTIAESGTLKESPVVKETIRTNNTESQTVAQWLFQSAWKRVFKDGIPAPGEAERNELLVAVAAKLDKSSKRNIAYSYNISNDISTYNIKLGKLEISRTKSN